MNEVVPICHRGPSQAFTTLSTNLVPFNENGKIFYHLVNFTKDLTKWEQIAIFSDVFGFVNRELWPLEAKSTPRYVQAYFKIAFVNEFNDYDIDGVPYECPFDFSANPGTLAVAYAHFPGMARSGWIFVNDAKFWSVYDKEGQFSLYKVLLHELLHGYGLGHTDREDDILYWQYGKYRVFTQDSRNGLDLLYSKLRLRHLKKEPYLLPFIELGQPESIKEQPSLIPVWWGDIKHFKPSEFDSPDKEGSGLNMDEGFIRLLDKAREAAGIPFVINSGYRTESHNKKVGGVANSSHLTGFAVDIKCSNSIDRGLLLKVLHQLGFSRIGIAETFVHVDLDAFKRSGVWLYNSSAMVVKDYEGEYPGEDVTMSKGDTPLSLEDTQWFFKRDYVAGHAKG